MKQVFDGNKDSKSVSKRVLPVPIEATYIRIYPLESEGWICMRAEVYGKGQFFYYIISPRIYIANINF